MKKVTQNHEHSESPRDIDWEAFGRNVRKYRKQKNLTQEQLAERCHMQPNSISRIKKESPEPKYPACWSWRTLWTSRRIPSCRAITMSKTTVMPNVFMHSKAD